MLKRIMKPILTILVIVFALLGFGAFIYFVFSNSESAKIVHGIVVQDSTRALSGENQYKKIVSNLKYDFPTKIFGSNYSIRAITLQEIQTNELYKRAGVVEPGAVVNLVFFSTQINDFRLLFDKPLYVQKFVYPIDSNYLGRTKIAYEVNTFDSNKDGVINSKDNAILFISDLDGKRLMQITPDSVSVVHFQFAENNQSIIIDTRYSPNDHNLDEYLWPHQQYWYDIANNKFKYVQFDKLLQQAKTIISK